MAAPSAAVDLASLLAHCIELAERAGDIIRQVRASGKLDIHLKGPNDPMTQADVDSQKLIASSLMQRLPQLFLICEEKLAIDPSLAAPPSGAATSAATGIVLPTPADVPPTLRTLPLADLVVCIDPLDATREYTLGSTDPVMCLIGIAYAGRPVAGVLHQPFLDAHGRTTYAIVGPQEGAPGTVRRSSPPPARQGNGFVLITTTADKESAAVAALQSHLGADTVLRAGGCGYKFLQVADGRADCYVLYQGSTKLWDTCAPEAVVLASGGVVTDRQGAKLRYTADRIADPLNAYGLVVANSCVYHERALTAVKQVHVQ